MSSGLMSKCRTCLSDSSNYHQLLDYVEENYKIIEMLDGMVPQIDIKSTAKFSTLICKSCVDKLLSGYKFQQLCIETNNQLHGLFGNRFFEMEAEKILNPWTGRLSLKSEDIEEDGCTKMRSSHDNDWIGDGGTGSDTDSSNRKLAMANKLSIKIENIKIDEPEMEQQLTERVSEDSLPDTCMREVEKPNHKGKHSCAECGKTFNGHSHLKRHSSVHSPTRPYECEICKYRFGRLNILKLHLSRHRKESGEDFNSKSRPAFFKCPFCPRRFQKQESLSAHLHMHKHNSSAANYLCRVCQRSFMSVKTLTEHITNQHAEFDKYKCDQCDKTFVLNAQLMEHLNRHKGSKKLVCIVCETEFIGYNNMKEHMRMHRNESSQLCPQCGIELCNISSLRRHMKKHALKKYQCPKCSSRYNFREHMFAHMHTHNLEKTHPCLQCGRRFSNATSLRRHMKKHTGLEMYPCTECSSSFAHSSELKKHASTH